MSDYTEVAARFQRDTASHEMAVLHDEGLYRHLRFKAPDTGFYWFDLVTWPGRLAFTGDMDGYVFARETDMFGFFRSGHGINPGYWSEKVDGGRDRTKRYSEDRFRQLVIEHFVDSVQYGDAPRGLGKAVRRELLEHPEANFEEGARTALDCFEFKGFRFTDTTWEWDLRDYDWTFLWACHAIRWGIAQYDKLLAPAVAR